MLVAPRQASLRSHASRNKALFTLMADIMRRYPTLVGRAMRALRALARGAALPRRPAETPRPQNPHVRLAELIAAGDDDGAEAVSLFLQAGLRRRALAAAERLDRSCLPPRTRMALAVARQDRIAIQCELAAAEQDYRDGGPAAIDALLRAEAALPAEPRLALRWFRRMGLAHPARGLYEDVSEATAETLAATSAHEQRWASDGLLIEANRRSATVDKLALLNELLGRQGLQSVAVRDAARSLTIENLAAEGPVMAAVDGPIVSVIVTCYDNAQLIPRSIESLQLQTYRRLELIVVDDASRDDTLTVLRELGAQDERVRVLHLPINVGTYAAKNAGLALASGEFVAFHDADDWAHPQRIAEAVKVLTQNPDCVAVSGLYTRLSAEGCFVSNVTWPLIRWTPNSVVIRRQLVVDRVGYFDEHRFGSDSEYVARVRAAFGERAHRKLKAIACLASHRAGSLMTATGTGVDSRGWSVARRRFEEIWSEALLERIKRGGGLHLSAGQSTRT